MQRYELLDHWIRWITHTELSAFVLDYAWVWPISESFHFCALTLMAGTVGLFDLRLLGLGKGVAPSALHRSLRWGVIGFVVSIITGILFIAGQPDQYFYNEAFRAKVVCLFLLGCNVVAFYSLEFSSVQRLGPNEDAPMRAKVIASLSLLLIAAVMLCGRMLTFFRPSFVIG